MGWLVARVSPLEVVRHRRHHANGFCARQAHHPHLVDGMHRRAAFVKGCRMPARDHRRGMANGGVRAGVVQAPREETAASTAGRELRSYGDLNSHSVV